MNVNAASTTSVEYFELFCGRKITGQYKRVKKAQIRAYVHGLWSYEWSIHGHVHFLRKVTSRRQSECFVTFPWFIFSRSNVFASRVWRVREDITGKIPSWLQKFRLPKVWTRSGLKPFPTQFMRGKAIITIINSNFQKMAKSHFLVLAGPYRGEVSFPTKLLSPAGEYWVGVR